MKFLLTIVFFLCFAACNSKDGKISRKDDPNLIHVDAEDGEMNSAIRKAQQTFGEFLEAFRSGKYDYYAVKYRFDYDEEVEHIWLGDLFEKDSTLYGSIANVPELVQHIDLGDTVQVYPSRVSDWIYSDTGVMRGGFTIRVLRSRLSDEEKKQLDEELGMKVE